MSNYQLFISYNHSDDNFRKDLERWIVTLRDKGLINHWSDSQILGGDSFWKKIENKLEEADIIVLLLSQEYLASPSCKREMQYALSVSMKKRVIPIVLKTCTWLDTETKDLLALPYDGRPINTWTSQEEAWSNVFDGLKKVVNDMDNNFKVKQDFLKDIQKIEFATQSSKEANLEDIFVFPNLKHYKDAFKSENIDLDFFLEKKKKSILLKGREFSGKTALLRWLFLKLQTEFYPILLDGNDIRKSTKLEKHIKKAFSDQISGEFENWMLQDNKVALIDNFSHNISYENIEYLSKNFLLTVVVVDDEEYMLYFKDEPNFAEYEIVSISQLDLVQQEKLIRKWLQASQQISEDEIDDLEVDKLEARVNNVVTTQRIVPRYPFYVLSILLSLATFMPSEVRITAYGHCYLALVTGQIVKKNIKPEDVDTCFNYLRNLSYNIYMKSTKGEVTYKDYQEFRAGYKNKFIISDTLLNKIENDDYAILHIQEDGVRFTHSYIYYFFLGMHLAFQEDKKIIDYLCENLQLRQNAFILIFTIHHTQNRDLLDTIRYHCLGTFENVRPAVLDTEETRFMNNLIAELPQSIISDRGTKANREHHRRQKERSVEENENPRNNDPEDTEKKEPDKINENTLELNKGMKIMEVLGQILKNRAGSFEIKDVESILDDTVSLGLRILNLLLNEYRKPEFKEWLSEKLIEKEKEVSDGQQRKFDDEKRREFIEKNIQFFGYMVTAGMLNRISEAVASEKLTYPMSVLAEKNQTPAYELIDYIISSSQDGAKVDHVKKLFARYQKSKNYWAEKVLSYYVQAYLNTHKVNYQDRQKLFKVLDLKYLPNKIQ